MRDHRHEQPVPDCVYLNDIREGRGVSRPIEGGNRIHVTGERIYRGIGKTGGGARSNLRAIAEDLITGHSHIIGAGFPAQAHLG